MCCDNFNIDNTEDNNRDDHSRSSDTNPEQACQHATVEYGDSIINTFNAPVEVLDPVGEISVFHTCDDPRIEPENSHGDI